MRVQGFLAIVLWVSGWNTAGWAQEKTAPQSEKPRLPIDYSHVPSAIALNHRGKEESEYFGRVYVLHTVLDSWKQGVGEQLPSLLPWLEADERIKQKWDLLVKRYHYRLIPLRQEGQLFAAKGPQATVDPIKREIRINLAEGVYLDADPATVLVGAICDAEFQHKMFDYSAPKRPYTREFQSALDDFFSKHKNVPPTEANTAIVASAWKHKRTALWQLTWYAKAADKMPLIQRDAFSDELVASLEAPREWRDAQIGKLTRKTGVTSVELVYEAWEFALPNWYDLPN